MSVEVFKFFMFKVADARVRSWLAVVAFSRSLILFLRIGMVSTCNSSE